MSENHVPFQKMSEFCDGRMDENERDLIRAHIGTCKACGDEYLRLQKTLSYLADYAARVRPFEDFSAETIGRINSIKRRRMFIKSLPAIAASFLIIVSFVLSEIGKTGSTPFVPEISRTDPVPGEAESIIKIIANHRNAKLITINDHYIEGEIPANEYRKLRMNLGPRKVTHALVLPNLEPRNRNRNIEEVGMSVSGFNEGAIKIDDSGRLVRFRVYR